MFPQAQTLLVDGCQHIRISFPYCGRSRLVGAGYVCSEGERTIGQESTSLFLLEALMDCGQRALFVRVRYEDRTGEP